MCVQKGNSGIEVEYFVGTMVYSRTLGGKAAGTSFPADSHLNLTDLAVVNLRDRSGMIMVNESMRGDSRSMT